PRYRTYAAIEKALFENPDLHSVFLTQYQQTQYQHSFGLNPDNNFLLPVCVDASFHYTDEKFQAARAWRKLNEQEAGRILLLFVAADFNTKGLDRVIEALMGLEEQKQSLFELWVVGNGKQASYENYLKQNRRIRYKFWGGQNELATFYLAADYLVHPARKEAAGMVLAEAAAARLPMFISDVCGYRFLAEHDAASTILNEKTIVTELITALATVDMVPHRTEKNTEVSALSRGELCADQIEAWCQ
ncbi:glycosyltransferase, partial [Methylophaga sp.]|uniref:glycosyltransferase n=1 Tax=Methylophaga sp. TaxID=2024840 RepID=UPI003F69A2D2